MLLKELRGEQYVKTQHNKKLAAQLNGRSKGSVEFKHENISAVLLEMELPYIDGYKPRLNYQGILRDVVAEYVDKHRGQLQSVAEAAANAKPDVVPAPNWQTVLVDPPQLIPPTKKAPVTKPAGKKFNFTEQEARNRLLGRRGEQFVLEFESMRLEGLGKKDLAKHIEWVSEKDDTAGFDILSFDDKDKERFIEVKTTNYGRSFPFLISSNEAEFSKAHADQYALYRLFTFRIEPRLFLLHGDVRTHCLLEPKTYRASFKGAA